MDGYPEPTVTVFKASEEKKSKNKKQSPKKRRNDSSLPQRQEKDKNQDRSKDRTFSAVKSSTQEDVCTCIRVLSEYVKEAVKLVVCSSSSKEPKFGPMFCELGDNTCRLLRDVYNFIMLLIKSLLRSLS